MKSEPGASGRDCAPAFRPPRRNRERSELAGDKGTGGEGGIRTPDGLPPMPHFECGAFDHSATSPDRVVAPEGAADT